MKKTLAAVAVLGAFAGSALAADVTLYGVIDTGLNWTQTKGSGFADATKNVTTDSFSMASGQNSGPRFGLKGTEDLGDGWKVGFNLENSFKSDTGSRMDNTVTYKSPTFAGVTVYAQASLKKSDIDDTGAAVAGQEGSSDAERYYGLGAKFSAEGLNAGLVFSTTDYARTDVKQDDDDNGYVVSGFVNYDFGMVKPMLAAQYWNNGDKLTAGKKAGTKGYGVELGATAPVLGGTIKAAAGWNDYENVADSNKDGNNWLVGVSYEYKLSKRTTLYTGAGYSEVKTKETKTTKTKTTEVLAGLVHTF